jgi:O-methyltransferase domain/Dimerisation domain
MKAADRRPPAQEVMLGLISGYWISQLVFVAAELGVADELAKGPRTMAALAKRVGAQPDALHRVMRALASVGVFAETADGRFRLTPAAATLRSGVPGSLRSFAQMMIAGHNWRGWQELLHAVRTGEVGFDRVHGMSYFPWLRAHPEEGQLFSESMASISGPENDAVARGYDFAKFDTLVDVGGAHGHLLAAILRRHKRLRGVLYDQPQVVAGAEASGFLREVAARCAIEGGDFFARVPKGADAYLMKYIIHDWDDDRASAILRHCREAMNPEGRVFVVEHVIAKGNAPDWAKLLDVNMLALLTGRERTLEQFRALFRSAGLKLRRAHPTRSALRILEAAAG